MNRKHNTISFYCSWVLPYILSKGIMVEDELDFYLVQETEKAIEFLKKLENKDIMDSEFISDFTQFCIYVSNMRHTMQACINATNDLNQKQFQVPIIFSSNDLILIDNVLEILYRVYKELVEYDVLDRNTNILMSSDGISSLALPMEIIKNNYEIDLQIIKKNENNKTIYKE